MNKMAVAIACCGGAVALGLVLMSFGTQAVLEDVEQGSGTIDVVSPLTLNVVMNPADDKEGVFAVQVLDDAEDATVSAVVLDPFGTEIASGMLESDISMEDRFEVGAEGTYSLVIYNDHDVDVLVFGAIGPVPDDGAKALAFVPFYVLLAGIMGMAGVAVYWTAGMRKRNRGF